jgi:hypothetical protein
MNNLSIIGITGRKRSGKDTIGHYLVDKHNYIRVGFADALKESCKVLFGLSDDQLYGTDKQKEEIDEYWGYSARQILQKIGTDLYRENISTVLPKISNDIWIRVLERKIMNYHKQGFNKFVITDVRFPNELEFVKKLNGRIWKVNRDLENIDNHPSEAFIDGFNNLLEIENNKTIDDLYKKVESLL